jgi:hypothetical protein
MKALRVRQRRELVIAPQRQMRFDPTRDAAVLVMLKRAPLFHAKKGDRCHESGGGRVGGQQETL